MFLRHLRLSADRVTVVCHSHRSCARNIKLTSFVVNSLKRFLAGFQPADPSGTVKSGVLSPLHCWCVLAAGPRSFWVIVDYECNINAREVNMVRARKWVVTKYFEGLPKRSDFDIVEYELPPLKDGEMLLKTEWISVDPYMRAFNRLYQVPYDQFGCQIGIVQETKDPKYPIGTRVFTHKGWCDYVIIKETENEPSIRHPDCMYKLSDLRGLSSSLGIGAIGMPGVSSYFGFLEICQPKPGETVVVTAAAGGVGSVVSQIAKIKGCKVIGFTGSDEKCEWLEKELGLDKALNYKKVDAQSALKEAAPEGVDCYFDNVGGELSRIIVEQMKIKGRVSVSGNISVYNDDPKQPSKSTIVQQHILLKELKVEGFIVWRWWNRWSEGLAQLEAWIRNGQLKAAEHVTVGFDKAFDALVGMFAGENTGKSIVKV